MTSVATTPPVDKEGAYIVRRPRSTDTIGNALRGVFDRQPALPEDMLRFLRKLDEATH